MAHPASRQPRLYIDGISAPADAMKSGCLYAIATEASPTKHPLMVRSILGNLNGGLPCTLIIDSVLDIEGKQEKALWGEGVQSKISDGSLNVFIPQDDFKKNIFRYGIKRFLKELELLAVPSDGYLWIQQAEDLFLMQDMPFAVKQAALLKEWLAERNITAVLVFSRLSKAEWDNIHLLLEGLDGLCRIEVTPNGLEARFVYWKSPDGVVDHENYGLSHQRSGFYLATRAGAAATPEAQPETVQADDYPKYFCLDQSLKSELDKTPWPWKYPESYLDLYHATRDSKTPTIVFEFSGNTDFIKLAETIHLIRLTVGRHAKIIVHENHYSLRPANETLLMLVGTNLVIHRDVPGWRIPKMIDSLEGARFERNLQVDIDALFANATTTFRIGSASNAEFTKEAVALVFNADCLSVPKAMIKGSVRPELQPDDVVERIKLSREGDLITAANNQVYIFLYACPESEVLTAIERKLGESIQSVFSSHEVLTDSARILGELDSIGDGDAPPVAVAAPEPIAPDPQRELDIHASHTSADVAGFTPLADAPLRNIVSEAANTFAEPEIPEPVGMPETPEVIEVPEHPEIAEIAQLPEAPEAPEIPETPKIPEIPETPEAPEIPEIPEPPEEPPTAPDATEPRTISEAPEPLDAAGSPEEPVIAPTPAYEAPRELAQALENPEDDSPASGDAAQPPNTGLEHSITPDTGMDQAPRVIDQPDAGLRENSFALPAEAAQAPGDREQLDENAGQSNIGSPTEIRAAQLDTEERTIEGVAGGMPEDVTTQDAPAMSAGSTEDLQASPVDAVDAGAPAPGHPKPSGVDDAANRRSDSNSDIKSILQRLAHGTSTSKTDGAKDKPQG